MKTFSKIVGSIINGPLLLVLAWPPAALAAGAPIDFRGVSLGSTEREFVGGTPGIRCNDVPVAQRALGDRTCRASGVLSDDRAILAYAGVQAKYIAAYFYSDRLSTIHVSLLPGQFTQVADALRVKFGPPTSEESPPFKTRGGLVAQNRVIIWQSGESRITAQLYSGSLDSSSISYIWAEGAREYTKRSAEASKANAKGL